MIQEEKEVSVLMLPTADFIHAPIIKSDEGDFIEIFANKSIGQILISDTLQHLYFTATDEIKEGNWIIQGNIERENHIIIKIEDKEDASHFNEMVEIMKSPRIPKNVITRKIVASTDLSLGLPAIPQSFIQSYVEARGRIDTVWLEVWEEDEEKRKRSALFPFFPLKIKGSEVVVLDEASHLSETMKSINSHDWDNFGLKEENKELEEAAKSYIDSKMGSSEYRLESPNDAYIQNRMDSFKEGWKANPNKWTDEDMIQFALKCVGPNGYDPIVLMLTQYNSNYTHKGKP